MADIKGEPVQSTGVVVNDLGVCTYVINGKGSTREDFNALNLARIAAALDVLANDVLAAAEEDAKGEEGDDDGDEPTPPSKKNIFGT